MLSCHRSRDSQETRSMSSGDKPAEKTLVLYNAQTECKSDKKQISAPYSVRSASLDFPKGPLTMILTTDSRDLRYQSVD